MGQRFLSFPKQARHTQACRQGRMAIVTGWVWQMQHCGGSPEDDSPSTNRVWSCVLRPSLTCFRWQERIWVGIWKTSSLTWTTLSTAPTSEEVTESGLSLLLLLRGTQHITKGYRSRGDCPRFSSRSDGLLKVKGWLSSPKSSNSWRSLISRHSSAPKRFPCKKASLNHGQGLPLRTWWKLLTLTPT